MTQFITTFAALTILATTISSAHAETMMNSSNSKNKTVRCKTEAQYSCRPHCTKVAVQVAFQQCMKRK